MRVWGPTAAVVVALALCAVPVALAQSQRPPRDVLSATDAVVAVHTSVGKGAGFVLEGANNEVITHDGVVRAQKDARITTIDGRELKGSVIGRDEEAGLAVLSVPGVRVGSIALAGESADEDDTVYAIGRPLGYSDRIVALAVDDLSNEGASRRIELDAGVTGDGLGGPLLNEAGDAVGVIVADPQGGALAVPVGRVARVERSASAEPLPWTAIGAGVVGGLIAFVLFVTWLTSRSRRHAVRSYERPPAV